MYEGSSRIPYKMHLPYLNPTLFNLGLVIRNASVLLKINDNKIIHIRYYFVILYGYLIPYTRHVGAG